MTCDDTIYPLLIADPDPAVRLIPSLKKRVPHCAQVRHPNNNLIVCRQANANCLSVSDCLLGLFVEDVDLLGIEGILNCIAGANLCCRLNSCSDVSAAEIEVQEYFCTEQFVYVYCGLKCIRSFLAALNFA